MRALPVGCPTIHRVNGRRLRLGLVVLGALGFAWGIAHVALSLSSHHIDDRGLTAALGLLVGWSFIGTGLFAWWRRPANRTGLLMVAAGFSWFATELSVSDNDVLYTIGIFMDGFFAAVVGHLLVAFPTGRLDTTAERVVAGAAYFTVTVLQLPSLLFEHPDTPRNLLIVESDQPLSDGSTPCSTSRRWPSWWRPSSSSCGAGAAAVGRSAAR